jgi:hypothetical protein
MHFHVGDVCHVFTAVSIGFADYDHDLLVWQRFF